MQGIVVIFFNFLNFPAFLIFVIGQIAPYEKQTRSMMKKNEAREF